MGTDARYIDLVQCLNEGLYRLPVDAVRELGPITMTLAGLLNVTDKMTYASAEKIARKTRLPLSTVRKHLVVLNDRGWIHNNGREQTEAGRPRRTCTIRITGKAVKAKGNYYPLPWWACAKRNDGRQHFSWGSKVLLGLVLRRLLEFKAVAEREPGSDGQDVFDLLDMGWFGEDRFAFSYNDVQTRTGLSREAIRDAQHFLQMLGVVRKEMSDDPHIGDSLTPSREFRVKVTSSEEGLCYLEFLAKA